MSLNFVPHNTALAMIEFQKEWIDPDVGKLGALVQDQNAFHASTVQACTLLEGARATGVRIVHVPCLFDPGYPEINGGLAAGLFKAIPNAGTWTDAGRPFAAGFEPRVGEFIVGGRIGASAFAHSNLDMYLRANGIEHVLLAGYALHVCVESTLRQGHDLGYHMTVISDACAAFTQRQRDHVISEVIHHFGDECTTDEALSGLGLTEVAA